MRLPREAPAMGRAFSPQRGIAHSLRHGRLRLPHNYVEDHTAKIINDLSSHSRWNDQHPSLEVLCLDLRLFTGIARRK